MSARTRLRHSGGVIASQALNSGTNFATAFLLARALSPDSYGSVAVCFAIVSLILGLMRGSLCVSLLAIWSNTDEHLRKERAALHNALGLGFLGVVPVGLAITATEGPSALYWLLPALPLLLVQDLGRYRHFSHRAPEKAAALDAVWAVVQMSTALQLGLSAPSLIASWALAAFVSGGLAFSQIARVTSHCRPKVRPSEFWTGVRGQTGFSAAEAIVVTALPQLVLLLLAAVASRAETGGFRAIQNLTLPLTTLAIVSVAIGMPMLALSRADTTRLRILTLRWSVVGSGCAAVYVVLVVAARDPLVGSVFGAEYSTYEGLVPPLALAGLVGTASVPAGAALRVLGETRALLLINLAAAAVTLAAAVPLINLYGGQGCATALLAHSVMTAAAYWMLVLLRTGPSSAPQRPGLQPGSPSM